jgi:hypothetical protein
VKYDFRLNKKRIEGTNGKGLVKFGKAEREKLTG